MGKITNEGSHSKAHSPIQLKTFGPHAVDAATVGAGALIMKPTENPTVKAAAI